MISRKPKLQRQKKIFKQGKNVPRPPQLNINVATWGRLMKRNTLSRPMSTPPTTPTTTPATLHHHSSNVLNNNQHVPPGL